jgi:hypothetical protein
MSGTVNTVFRPDITDYSPPPQNRLAQFLPYGAPQVWPMSNPVGTETTQSMGQATPIDQIAFMRSDGTPVMASDMARAHQDVQTAMQVAPTMVLGMMGTTDPAGVRAFHGSPYDFERFDTSRIGTGEGAQAYGHGLYFAEKEGTAQSYRDALTQGQGGFNDIDTVLRRFSGFQPSEADVREALTGHSTLTSLADNPAVVDAVRRLSPDYSPTGAVTGDALRHYRTINDAIEAAAPKGKMYEVNIGADPEQFLHWDKPFSEQSQYVKDALNKAGIPTTQVYSYAGTRSFPTREGADAIAQSQKLSDYTIRQDADGYQIVTPRPGTGSDVVAGARNPAEASATLRAAGIPGIRYLDQGSRGAGEGTHNYVVFDANTIDILRKYGIAGLMAGGGAAAAGSQQQSQ